MEINASYFFFFQIPVAKHPISLSIPNRLPRQINMAYIPKSQSSLCDNLNGLQLREAGTHRDLQLVQFLRDFFFCVACEREIPAVGIYSIAICIREKKTTVSLFSKIHILPDILVYEQPKYVQEKLLFFFFFLPSLRSKLVWHKDRKFIINY